MDVENLIAMVEKLAVVGKGNNTKKGKMKG